MEKILGPDEPLPAQWPVAGTTGYDFLRWVNGLLVDWDGLQALKRAYGRFVGHVADFREVVHASKITILRGAMSSELQLLARRLNRLSERHRRFRDFTLNMLRHALREIIACFAVYRTYLRPQEISERDRRIVVRAAAQAKRRNPDLAAGAFDFVRDALLFEQPAPLDLNGCRERELFVGRFQQVSSPVMAKGVEDTAFNRYFPLSSLNEVGDNPSGRPGPASGCPVEDFHRENAARLLDWPGSLLATTTHDTKRSEDAQARIDVLSEVPQEWARMVNRWSRLNRSYRREVDSAAAPSRGDEYLFYQSLLAIWPLSPPDEAGRRQLIERLQTFMEKAIREAKLHTSWLNPNIAYEAALGEFVAASLEPGHPGHPLAGRGSTRNRFLALFAEFHAVIARFGLFNALSQVLLKLTSPGVPDTYQGQELWDFSLVDPDNRRPVDFALREKLLIGLQREVARSRAGGGACPAAGQAAVRPAAEALCRLANAAISPRTGVAVSRGALPSAASLGRRAEHLCAYAWQGAENGAASCQNVIVVVPRLLARMVRAAAPCKRELPSDRAGRLARNADRTSADPLPTRCAGATYPGAADVRQFVYRTNLSRGCRQPEGRRDSCRLSRGPAHGWAVTVFVVPYF